MDKWEYAYYLIEAKKQIDSMIYITDHAHELTNIDLREKSVGFRNKFYLSLAIILDRIVKEDKLDKFKIRKKYPPIKAIYYERNKNTAHKDDSYKPKIYDSLQEIVDEMKLEIECVKEFCYEHLPPSITLDYVSHDPELFRLLNQLNAKQEETIKKKKHPGYDKDNSKIEQHGKSYKIIHDFEDIKRIPEDERSEYCVVMENGINLEEGVQKRQDGFIKTNFLTGSDIWPSPQEWSMEFMMDLRNTGVADKFDIIAGEGINKIITDPILWNRFLDLTKKYPLNNKHFK